MSAGLLISGASEGTLYLGNGTKKTQASDHLLALSRRKPCASGLRGLGLLKVKFAGKSLQREVQLLPHYTGSALAPLIKREEKRFFSTLWAGRRAGGDAVMGRGAGGGGEGRFAPRTCLRAERVFGWRTCLLEGKPGSSPPRGTGDAVSK